MTNKIQFIQALKAAGSDISADFNTSILHGVPGMPLTHQTGFGRALREGVHPQDVNIDQMNDRTHLRMLKTLGLLVVGTKLMNQGTTLSLITGGSLVAFAAKELSEFYKDWQAGFLAAKHLDFRYVERMQIPMHLIAKW